MVSIYVGVTDGDWFRFLSRRPGITEVNFWQPVDTRRFGALIPGELFLFKLKAPDHFIAGGGLFVTANAYPTSLAWAAFGEGNGVASLDELRQRIGRLSRPFRDQPFDTTRDPPIGRRILEEPFFFPRDRWIPVPSKLVPEPRSGAYLRYGHRGRPIPLGSGNGETRKDRSGADRADCPVRDPRPDRTPARPRCFPRRGNGRLRPPLRAHGREDAADPRCRPYPSVWGWQPRNSQWAATANRHSSEDFENGRHYYQMHGQSL
jgi:putative restriction endonuclease